MIGEEHWDPWRGRARLELYSLLVSRAALDHAEVCWVQRRRRSGWEMLASAQRAGLRVESFPFSAGGYVIHVGRASLAAVVESDDRSNPLYGWALDHHEPHFGGVDGAADRYAANVEQFEREVGPAFDVVAALQS